MSNLKMSKFAIVTVAAGVVILLNAETTKAGGFSIRVGGIGFGSWNTRCVERSYIYVDDYDYDCSPYRVYSTSYYYPRPRPYVRYYNPRPYYGGGRYYHPTPYRGHGGYRGGHGGYGGGRGGYGGHGGHGGGHRR